MNSSRIKKINDYAIIGLFFIITLMPLMDNIVKLDKTPVSDNRALAEMPEFPKSFDDLPSYFNKFDTFYRDRFGFRNFLIRTYSLLFFRVFGEDGSRQVIIGKDGWLFYGLDSSIETYRKTISLTQEELESWKFMLEARQHWNEERGIKYIFFVAPNKETIYSEFMPDWIDQVGEKYALEQLINYLRNNSNVNIVDLRQTLLTHRNEYHLYHKTDTHWTAYGAYYGYREVMSEIARVTNESSFEPYDLEQFDLRPIKRRGLDLAEMLSLPDLYTDVSYGVSKRGLPEVLSTDNGVKQSRFRDKKLERTRAYALEHKGINSKKAVIFRSSFGERMLPFFASHFDRIVQYYQSEFDSRVVRHESPDVVFHEVVERSIPRLTVEYLRRYKESKKRHVS